MATNTNAFAFETALVQFKSGLKKRDRDKFKDVTLEGLLKEIENIQNTQHSQRRGKNIARLQPFIEAMNEFGKVIEVFCNTTEMVAFVWVESPQTNNPSLQSTKFSTGTDEVAGSFAEAFHELLDVYAKLGESLPLLHQYQQLFQTDPNMLKVLTTMYKDILEFHRQALKYFQLPTWKQIFGSIWKTYKSRFGPLIDNIRGHGDLVQKQATLTQIEVYRKDTETHTRQLQSIKEVQEMQMLREVISWLGAPNAENDQYQYSKIREECPGTGRWLLDIQAFKEWIDPKFPTIPPLLWITGMPGAGKTILASLVVEEIRKILPPPITLFFYCKNGDDEKNSFTSIGRNFLAQLLNTNKEILLPYYWDKFSNSSEPVLNTYPLIESILEVALQTCASVYIVLDGIDECEREQRKRITGWFRGLVENLQPPHQDRIRCLFVSQDDGVARKDFRALTSFKIESKHNRADIEIYSKSAADKIQSSFQLSDDMSHQIAIKTQVAADGMFLLAKLISINLSQQTSVADLENELEDDRVPRELNEAYSRILERLLGQASSAERVSSETLLRWLVCAKRALKWHEIQAAKSIHVESQSVDLERRRFRVDSKDLCGSLVEIRDDGTVEFVHTTAKHFLISSSYVDVCRGNISLATLAIDYLNMAGFRRNAEDVTALILKGYYGFMEYAVAHWVRHLEEVADETTDNELFRDISESLETFLELHYTSPTKRLPISQENAKRLRLFQDRSFHDDLQQAVASIRKELTHFGEMQQNEIAFDLTNITNSIRHILEKTYIDEGQRAGAERMKEMYGQNIFKCPRLSCRYFCDGFPMADQRDRHVNKHTRPFHCTVVGCPTNILGLTSAKELERHMKEIHGLIKDIDLDFPEDEEIARSKRDGHDTGTSKGGLTGPRKRPRITEFLCPHCQRIFKKKYNLDSHLKTHSDSRPFSCHECGAPFARHHDLNRHEKTHKEKEFICGGELENGQRWGCQKKFARADTLQSHYKTESGQSCIPPWRNAQAHGVGT
ncbi:hypothetical protein F4677DRAFT_459629 [Hypoxylon crocopeplum]|nr:hypothetical protein F4677DRAFT_459629 [Hypoxylon crocopeplum]